MRNVVTTKLPLPVRHVIVTRALDFVHSAVTALRVDINDHHVCYMSLTKQLCQSKYVVLCITLLKMRNNIRHTLT